MKNVHEIEIEINGEEWANALDASFKKAVKNVKIDGFRKGSVPKDVYIKKMGIKSLYADAVDMALSNAYNNVLRDNNLIPVCEPKIDIKEIDDKHVKYLFSIITKPEVKIGKYKNLGIKKDAVKVTKEDIKTEVAKICSRLAEIVVKEDGVAEEGNAAVIDFEGIVDGKVLEGGTGANYPLELGSHTFIPGFEEGVVGMKVGETKELNLKFPENYTPELANKDVLFKVTLREIKERVLPELNKEFYKDLGFDNIENEEQFNEEVKKNLEAKKQAEIDDKYVNDCLEAASKNMTCEINEEIIDDEIHRMMNQFANQLKMQGLSIEQYLQFSGQTNDDLHKQMEPEASRRVHYRYLLEGIADEEKIEISDDDAKEEAEKMAAEYGVSKEEFLSNFGGLDIVKYDMKMRKAIEILSKN